MSLVEQALARMRHQAGASDTQKKPQGRSARPTVAPAQQPQPQPLEPAKRMVLDTSSLRAKGYLPEEAKDRQFADHYRRIKRPLIDHALSNTKSGSDARVIMVTSALPGDGKTFTCVNLALSMALERDISVLLIDCDVAKRHVSEIVGVKHERGLLDALANESLNIESLVAQTDIRGLSILPAGKPIEGTAELLTSNRMRQIISELFANNPRRILLLDSSPLLITNEGRALVKLAGQVVVVVRAGHTPKFAVEEALTLFDPEKPGGLILNDMGSRGSEGFYGYDTYGLYGDSDADAKSS